MLLLLLLLLPPPVMGLLRGDARHTATDANSCRHQRHHPWATGVRCCLLSACAASHVVPAPVLVVSLVLVRV